MRTRLAAPLLGALLVLSAGLRADDKADKADVKLDGTYTVVAGENDGKAVPPEKIKGSVVLISGNKITGTDKDRKEFFAATYTLDTSKTPWVIKMKSTAPKEAEATGLLKKEGDTVTIVYSLPGAKAPTEFKTAEGQNMFVLKNTAKGGKKDR
jgi:uncharacterized protein (TIGR03067 family)